MKGALMIISLIAALFLSQGKKMRPEEKKQADYTAAQVDSALEMGRVERMKNKFN